MLVTKRKIRIPTSKAHGLAQKSEKVKENF
jgi:hypothetical protein